MTCTTPLKTTGSKLPPTMWFWDQKELPILVLVDLKEDFFFSCVVGIIMPATLVVCEGIGNM